MRLRGVSCFATFPSELSFDSVKKFVTDAWLRISGIKTCNGRH
jgi:hypothetical protein